MIDIAASRPLISNLVVTVAFMTSPALARVLSCVIRVYVFRDYHIRSTTGDFTLRRSHFVIVGNDRSRLEL